MASTLDVLDSDNVLNRGTVANDNTGDTLRSAGLKINNQFENVDSAMFNTSWAVWPAGVKENNSVLRYNGSKFVGTNNVKIDSDGNTTIYGSLDATGAVTFSDSASFSTNVNLSDGARLQMGDNAEFQIYHTSGGNSVISETGSANLDIRANQLNVLNANGTETMITAQPDNAVTLYYNGNAKVATTNTGVSVTGNVVADSATISGDANVTGHVDMPDNSKIKLGTGDDFEMYFDPTGNGQGVIATTQLNTPVIVKHNNSVKMRSTDSGMEVVGNLQVTNNNLGGYERVFAAYAAVTDGTIILDNNNMRNDANASGFSSNATWDTIVENTIGFSCTAGVTEIRDLFQIGTAPLDDIYYVKVVATLSTVTAGPTVFRDYIFACEDQGIPNNVARLADNDFIFTATVRGKNISQYIGGTTTAFGTTVSNSNGTVNSSGYNYDNSSLYNKTYKARPLVFSFTHNNANSSYDVVTGTPHSNWSLTGGNNANFAVEVFRNRSNRISQLTGLPST